MDPAAFENPHAFDIERQANRHLSFGRGAHSCLGVALARLEAEIAFSTLIARFPTLQLATSSVRWHPTISFRGLQELPLTW
jgi:cytochrome P450